MCTSAVCRVCGDGVKLWGCTVMFIFVYVNADYTHYLIGCVFSVGIGHGAVCMV